MKVRKLLFFYSYKSRFREFFFVYDIRAFDKLGVRVNFQKIIVLVNKELSSVYLKCIG